MNKEESDRSAAIIYILRVIKSPMMVMSFAKKQALTLAEEHSITVTELITEYEKIAMRI
jgi:hypothetical protein